MKRFLIISTVLAVAIGFTTIGMASDQTVVVAKPPRVCTVTIPAPLNLNNAGDAIRAALNIAKVDHSTYYLIHDVSYNSDGTVSEQHWYVYLYDWAQKHTIFQKLEDTRIKHHFEEARVYGSKNLAIAYFLRNVTAIDEGTAIERAKAVVNAAAAGTPAAGLKLPDTTAPNPHVQALVVEKVIGGDPNAGGDVLVGNISLVNMANGTLTGFKPEGQDGYVIDAPFAALPSITYTIDITKEVPAPIQNLEGILSVIGHGQPGSLAIAVDQHITLCGGQAFQVTPLPSQMTVTAATGKDKKEIGKNTYDNEQKYWYDFSFALPLKSFNDLTVNSSDLTLTAKNVQKQNLFAMVNLSLPYDTKKAQYQLIPVFLYGLPITGKPLNHHLLAGAIGLNRVQFFVGVMVNHNQQVANAAPIPPHTSNGTSTGTGQVQDSWGAKLSYGINFPVSTITNLLKKK